MPDISIILVTWNGKDVAAECLASIAAHSTGFSTEVIVVDNASTDGTPEMIADQFPWVTLIRNGSNLGFARANNIGIRRASGEYVCLVNSDVTLKEGCLEAMVEFMQQQPSIGVL